MKFAPIIVRNIVSGTILDLSRRQNVIFWVSQLAVILSTVLGVYLAASAGLKTAVDFHSIVSQEKNFYTLSALKEEINYNNDLLLDFADKNFGFNDDGKAISYKGRTLPQLNWFVWTTMANTTEALELPADILRDTNRYHLTLIKELKNFKESYGVDKVGVARRFLKLIEETNTELIPRMQDQLTNYQRNFAPYKELGKH
ncbi:MAG: hypothetical protein ACRBCI_11220 [Cellvibrionaceae bacterium]